METATIPSESAHPREVTLSEDRRSLTVAWEDGGTTAIPAETLRLACWCAWCRTDRILERFPGRFEGITIQHLNTIGSYALHITFSDSHARGIFPWSYLMDVAEGRAPATERPRAVNLSASSNAAAAMAPESKA